MNRKAVFNPSVRWSLPCLNPKGLMNTNSTLRRLRSLLIQPIFHVITLLKGCSIDKQRLFKKAGNSLWLLVRDSLISVFQEELPVIVIPKPKQHRLLHHGQIRQGTTRLLYLSSPNHVAIQKLQLSN